ncbi:MAG TPA: class I SAM-dependent methyltransferase [Gammaproteobacteria bacterium]|nr:class I SAM-dependent methyltransferase [Gammaproteobacteria bacterium]
MTDQQCRNCGAPLSRTFVDLGMSPLCESYIAAAQLNQPEIFYPLHAYVCEHCLLVQLLQYVTPEHIFSEYAYFSSYSDSWNEHARRYCEAMVERFQLGRDSLVIEIASNDGYLLQHFVDRRIPCFGVEPAANVAQAAIDRGIPTEVRFFGSAAAHELLSRPGRPDLLIGNNVLAHVPDLNDFIAGMKTLLKPTGIITMEFPHLLRLMQQNQFDTIYHEHFSYFSFFVVEQAFARHGLTLFDVEELSTHGGSLRIYGRHAENATLPVSERVIELRTRESALGFDRLETYSLFQERVSGTKRRLLEFLIEAKRGGRRVVGYGAPGKGNTLLNYCGIRTDFLDYTVDRSLYKQGQFTPGTHIPILHPDRILQTRPDYLLILPWNLADEISRQMAVIREWGGRFVVPIPEVRVW